MNLYCVSVQIFCETPEEAVRRTIIPGSTETADVNDYQGEIKGTITLPVPKKELVDLLLEDILEDSLPLEDD